MFQFHKQFSRFVKEGVGKPPEEKKAHGCGEAGETMYLYRSSVSRLAYTQKKWQRKRCPVTAPPFAAVSKPSQARRTVAHLGWPFVQNGIKLKRKIFNKNFNRINPHR